MHLSVSSHIIFIFVVITKHFPFLSLVDLNVVVVLIYLESEVFNVYYVVIGLYNHFSAWICFIFERAWFFYTTYRMVQTNFQHEKKNVTYLYI